MHTTSTLYCEPNLCTCSWQPDPQAPFQMPSHLREAVAEFERSQVPEMGLRSSSIPSASDSVPYQNQQSSEDLEFVYSYATLSLYSHMHTMHTMS